MNTSEDIRINWFSRFFNGARFSLSEIHQIKVRRSLKHKELRSVEIFKLFFMVEHRTGTFNSVVCNFKLATFCRKLPRNAYPQVCNHSFWVQFATFKGMLLFNCKSAQMQSIAEVLVWTKKGYICQPGIQLGFILVTCWDPYQYSRLGKQLELFLIHVLIRAAKVRKFISATFFWMYAAPQLHLCTSTINQLCENVDSKSGNWIRDIGVICGDLTARLRRLLNQYKFGSSSKFLKCGSPILKVCNCISATFWSPHFCNWFLCL